MSLARRHALITGSASGLGQALARQLAREGWYLALADINDEANRQTLEQVRAAGGDGQLEHLDVSSREAWSALAQKLSAAWPQLDLLINNAGVAAAGEVGLYPLDDWEWVMSVNFWGVLYGCHTFVDWLKRNPAGAHIINTASLAGLICAPTMGAYNVSKAGVVALSETLYGELRQHNVGVTVLCPSFFDSNLLASARMHKPELIELAGRTMRGASFTADDVATAALRAMRRKKLHVTVPFKGTLWWWMKRQYPGIFMNIVARLFARGLPKSL
jgi:NAD(P)-dependent dehydrogenase (short-subunit alcohol dehydrogenase family)